jgi:hypothetical protein
MTRRQLRGGALAALIALYMGLFAGCKGDGTPGGSSSTSGAGGTSTAGQNVTSMVVNSGPNGNAANVGYISVTVCVPGTSNCQTINDIDVDTGSTGLRLLATALSPNLALTQQADVSGNPIVECTAFADGYVWGSIKLADVTVAGEKAASLPVQIIGDPNFALVPADCSGTGINESTVAAFGANGIIGIGIFLQDCGAVCAGEALPGAYYICPTTGCTNAVVATTEQVQNPVSLFPVDNNGVLIQLPSVPATGSATVIGSLIFGIGTQSNNALGSVTIFDVSSETGYLTVVLNGTGYVDSYVDSGSSAIFLPSSFGPSCAGTQQSGSFMCPATTLALSGTVQGTNGTSEAITLSIANETTLVEAEPTFTAFSNLGAINADFSSVDLGMPFFYGRSIFTAIETKTTPGGTGPFVAF